MRMTALAFACLLLCSVSDCQATPQDSATQPPKPSLVLREGVGVYLNFAQTVTKKTARDGEPVELVLAQDLNVGDTVVAAAGSRAVGVVVRKDEFQVRPTWLQAGRTKVPLRGSLNIPEEIYTAASRSQGPDRVYVAADTELPWSSQPVSTVGKDASAVADIPANKILLPSGKTVRLVLMQSISSNTVKVGDSVKFQVLDAVKVDNLVVIANKAPAAATINASHPAARAWRAGGVEMRMDFVTLVDHQKQPLQALTASKGAATNAGADWADCIGQVFGCI